MTSSGRIPGLRQYASAGSSSLTLVVLDVMLPDLDGLEVCKKIREFSYCSILFLSSKNDDIDKILGLSCGGDDYLQKIQSKRIGFPHQTQLRRQQYQASPCLCWTGKGNFKCRGSYTLR